MLIVHVHIRVKPDQVDAFKAACVENSRNMSRTDRDPFFSCGNGAGQQTLGRGST